jgi:hypothetical protein
MSPSHSVFVANNWVSLIAGWTDLPVITYSAVLSLKYKLIVIIICLQVKHEHPNATVIATSENVTLNSVERRDSGTYKCTAKNEYGPEASALVYIHVTCKYGTKFMTVHIMCVSQAHISHSRIWYMVISLCFWIHYCGVAVSSTLSQMVCYASSQASINCLAFKPCTVESVIV